MYPLETLWDDGEFVLSRSVPDSVGKRMPKAYLQVAPASSRWCRPWRRAPPAATMRPNNQLPSGASHDSIPSTSPPIFTIYVEVIYGN